MRGEQFLAVKCFVALVTNVLLFTAVNREVYAELALAAEHFVAKLADKIAVRQRMFLEIASLKKTFFALVAGVEFCAVNVTKVSGEVAPRRK